MATRIDRAIRRIELDPDRTFVAGLTGFTADRRFEVHRVAFFEVEGRAQSIIGERRGGYIRPHWLRAP